MMISKLITSVLDRLSTAVQNLYITNAILNLIAAEWDLADAFVVIAKTIMTNC